MAAPMVSGVIKTPESFPVKTKQVAVEINKIRTELICTQFKDRIFFIVTQYNKIGTLVKVTQNNITDDTGTGLSMYSTDILMGKDEPLTHVIARNLITELSVHKPILLSFALKDTTAPTVKTIAKILPSIV
ncbi:proteasome assembly chaperone 3-like [Ruditapes philippinarum]|uniref:proteasome assembly chaperone 3-like n=1 Tax=Ruditapes philippinarum TaxID=129788 RepID=UPI00295C0F92|nr:proteasome assembly chaperone 3-like [Ruditapes philippinarum]